MEKFAVDLDKVLDDFELNEDRAERFAAKNKTPPKLQQPLLGRVSGRSSSKWECYSRPELPERLRRINLVDADFAPDPNSISSPRVPNSIDDGTSGLQENKNVSISLKVDQLPHTSDYWLQHELNILKSHSADLAVKSEDVIVPEPSSDETLGTVAFSSINDSIREQNADIPDEKLRVNDETYIMGFGKSLSGNCTSTEEQVVVLPENNAVEEEPTLLNTFVLSKGVIREVDNESEPYSDLVGQNSSESNLISSSVLSKVTEIVVELTSNASDDYNSLEPIKLPIYDRPLESRYENGKLENVPLDSLEMRHAAHSSEDTTLAENHLNFEVLSEGIGPFSSVHIPNEDDEKPVAFHLEEDMSDSEVNRYLEELEYEDRGNKEEAILVEDEGDKIVMTTVQDSVEIVVKDETFNLSETEKEKLKNEEKMFVEEDMLSGKDKDIVIENDISIEMDVPERQTVHTAAGPERQCVKSDNESEEEEVGASEHMALGVPSSSCPLLVDECMVGEDKIGKEVQHVEGVGMMEKSLIGDSQKGEIDCRVESWVVAGNGKLLEGASIGERTPTVDHDMESNNQNIRSPAPVRPDSLSIAGVVASARTCSIDEEDPIPKPFIIGPPGATPANPRPPMEIAAEIYNPLKQESEGNAAASGSQEPPSCPSVSIHVQSVSSNQDEDALGAVVINKRLEQSPVLSTEGSLPLSQEEEDAREALGDRKDVPESGEDSSPDSGDRSSFPGNEPSGAGHSGHNVTVGSAINNSLDISLSLPAGSGLGASSDETDCSTLALGDIAPFWVPDGDASSCMSCAAKFTLIKRRHHCRACGKVLCSKCCSSRARLAYMDHSEARVCMPCHSILQDAAALSGSHSNTGAERYQCGSWEGDGGSSEHSPRQRHGFGRPDPNNPMEYCSTVPPLEQVGERARAPPPTVMVPVGVLKREGSNRSKGEAKQVMFSDGIRPGGELSELDQSPTALSGSAKCQGLSTIQRKIASRLGKRLPGVVPPEYNFEEGPELDHLMETLREEAEPPVAFALSKNFFVLVKIINLDCCVNRIVWSFTTRGMRCVGQDEVIVLLEWLPSDKGPPRDIFCHLGALYDQAAKGNTVTELGHSTVQGMFLGSHNHGGFLYIRATFQCLRRLPLPPPPFLFGLLLHRMETPWAKVFPIRVMLRLGAEFRYYPCPLIGIRGREPVYQQIGHTIMNLLSDFRNFAYVLPSVRGMVIHMEERQTSILLPKNRLSQVERALDDSDDHVLALAASFSSIADSHLVCVQGESGDSSTGSNHYHTQAINIQNKPRKVTGASFVVFNGALKASAKLTAKSSIVEDGLMVQVLPDTLTTLRNALRNAEDFIIPCGPISLVTPSVKQSNNDNSENSSAMPSQPIPDEVVIIRWVEDDKNFNIGVKSPIDGMALDGIPSIRVHNGTNYVSDTKFIRWTEVFLIQCAEAPGGRGDTTDVSRISESIAHGACLALHPYLDLLWSHALTLIAVRATLGPDSEGYEAGCGGSRLPPIYMNGLDNELVGILHRIEARPRHGNLVLELLFHLMEL